MPLKAWTTQNCMFIPPLVLLLIRRLREPYPRFDGNEHPIWSQVFFPQFGAWAPGRVLINYSADRSARCRRLPQTQIFIGPARMSAWCQQPTLLLNHLVGGEHELSWNVQAEC